MSRTVKKLVLYGALLVAGAAAGMQLAGEEPEADLTRSITSGAQQQRFSGQAQTQGAQVRSREPANEIQPSPQSPTSDAAPPPSQLENPSGDGNGYLTPGEMLLQPAEQSAVDKLANKTGELLQTASRKSIDWVVSLFGVFTD